MLTFNKVIMKNYIAYKGIEYTIEWYYDSRGRSKALEYYEELSDARKAKLFALLVRMADHSKIVDETKFRNEGDGIYAFKPQPDRYLCFFFKGKKIIITNAFIKKVQKMPKQEKERALQASDDYKTRVTNGTYYER